MASTNQSSSLHISYQTILIALIAIGFIALPFVGSFVFSAHAAAENDVSIVEVMPNPAGIDADGEYILLENSSASSSVSLEDWSLDSSSSHTFSSGTSISNTLKVCRGTNASSTASNCDVFDADIELANGGDTITLMDDQGDKIDEETYNDRSGDEGEDNPETFSAESPDESTTAEECENPSPNNDLSVDSFDASAGTVTITNSSENCAYDAGIAAYKGFTHRDNNQNKLKISDQQLFDHATDTVPADDEINFNIDVPECAYQIDVFHGDLIEDLEDPGNLYGDRKLGDAFSHENTDNLCGDSDKTATLRVCKLISDDGQLTGGEDGTDFQLHVAGTNDGNNFDETASFSTPLDYENNGTDLFGDGAPDAVCQTYDVTPGDYTYDEETANPDLNNYKTPLYNDLDPNGLSDFSEYDTQGPDKSDGEITELGEGERRTLVVKNRPADNREEPTACPFTDQGKNEWVFDDFTDDRLLSNDDQWDGDHWPENEETDPLTVNLEAGTYDVKIFTHDSYADRDGVTQPYEQSYLSFRNDSGEVASTTATSDLKDRVETATATSEFTDVSVGSDVNTLVGVHSFYDKPWANSHGFECVKLEKQEKRQTGSIHGKKLNWDNKKGIANWQINLHEFWSQSDGYDTDPVATTTTIQDDTATPDTDESGQYWFENVPYGDYLVCEKNRGDWNQTSPASSSDTYECENGTTGHVVTVGPDNPTSKGNDFMNRKGETAGDQCEPGKQFVDEVVSAEQGSNKDGEDIPDDRSDPQAMLDDPDGDFWSIGKNGTVTLKFDEFIVDQDELHDGGDISIHEITGGDRATYVDETVKVEVSKNGNSWHSLGEVSSQQSAVTYLDIASTGFNYVQYVRLTDTADYSQYDGNPSDGFDVDAIDGVEGECNRPIPEIPQCETADQRWADGVVSYDPGDAYGGDSIATNRTDPSEATGPDGPSDDEIDFVSLGFGGELVLSFDQAIPDKSGDDLRIYETTYGQESTSTYPETAKVYGSETGTSSGDFKLLGSVTIDEGPGHVDTVDIDGSGLSEVRFIKIEDTSTESDFDNKGGKRDGFDVAGVEGLTCGEGDGEVSQCEADILHLDTGLAANDDEGELFTVDENTGDTTLELDYETGFHSVLASDGDDSDLYSIKKDNDMLVTLDDNEQLTDIGETMGLDKPVAMDFVNNTLYVLDQDSDTLHTIDPSDGTTSGGDNVQEEGNLTNNLGVNGGDLADPRDGSGTIIYVHEDGMVYRIDPTGTPSYEELESVNGPDHITSVVKKNGTYYAMDRKQVNDDQDGALYTFEINNNNLTNINDTQETGPYQYGDGTCGIAPENEDDGSEDGGGSGDDSESTFTADASSGGGIQSPRNGGGDDELDDPEEVRGASTTSDPITDAELNDMLAEARDRAQNLLNSLNERQQVAGAQTPGLPNTGDGSLTDTKQVAQADPGTGRLPPEQAPTTTSGTTTDDGEAATGTAATTSDQGTATSSEDTDEAATGTAADSDGFGWGFWVALIGLLIVITLLYRDSNDKTDSLSGGTDDPQAVGSDQEDTSSDQDDQPRVDTRKYDTS